MGRECTTGDRRSGPVPTAERLDHPDRTPPKGAPRIGVAAEDPDGTSTRSPSPQTTQDSNLDTDARIVPRGGAVTRRREFPGDHTGGATPVPIPNTAVKPAGPMIVPKARKSDIAGIPHQARPRSEQSQRGRAFSIPDAPRYELIRAS